jgi:hypothetical protein
MVEIPRQLLKQLSRADAQLLRTVLLVIAEELPLIYLANKRDHRPRDNLNIFGLRVSVHLWRALKERHADLADADIVEENNATYLRIGPLKVGIHKLGQSADDDIHSSFPDGTATQRSYGKGNAAQLALFEANPLPPIPDEQAFALTQLTVGHFGNPEDGFAKWYVGAYIYDDEGRPGWAWATRQSIAGEASDLPNVTPYHERVAEALELSPRHTNKPMADDKGSA